MFPGKFHDFVENSHIVYFVYAAVHLACWCFYGGALSAYLRIANLDPLCILSDFSDLTDFAGANGLIAFSRNDTLRSVLWLIAAVLAVFLV